MQDDALPVLSPSCDFRAEIAYQELIIDAGCLALVQDPTQFDVLLMENLYGGS